MSRAGRRDALPVKDLLDGEQPGARGDHLKDAAHDEHPIGIHLITLTVGGEAKAIDGLAIGDYLALSCFAKLSASAPFGYFGPLVTRYLIQDSVRKLSLW